VYTKLYGYTYTNQNLTGLFRDDVRLPVTYPLDPVQYTFDTIHFEYYNSVNSGMIPFQANSSPLFLENTLSYPTVDPIYILGLNGYYAYAKNNNLLKTYNVNGAEWKYNYDINPDNQVTEMRILLNPRKEVTFRFEYY
jgi:hypothetical protein